MLDDAYAAGEVSSRFSELGVVRPLSEFSRDADAPLDLRRASAAVAAALELLSGFYVHLPFKRTAHAANAEQLLRLFANHLADIQTGEDEAVGGEILSEIEFHDRMTEIFRTLRDRHTRYVLPARYRRAIAFLPFQIEECAEPGGERKYVISKTYGDLWDADPSSDGRDASTHPIVTHWNGVPIARGVELNAERTPGANPAARHARGLDWLTFRWLGTSPRTSEDWVVVTYKRGDDEAERHLSFPWAVIERPDDTADDDAIRGNAFTLGRDTEGEWIRRMKKTLFADRARWGEGSFADVISYKPIEHPKSQERYGYLRIFSFHVDEDDVDAFLEAVIGYLQQAPSRGLIIDLRGNPGGSMVAAERLLQLFSPREVEPEGLQFINTPSALTLARRLYASSPNSIGALADFKPLERDGRATAAPHVTSLPLAPLHDYRAIGQVYQGPVVLVVDALTYSAAEIFAAGMEDHGLAKIIGTAAQTGGGGANVWSYEQIRNTYGADDGLPELDDETSFQIAVRRTTRVRTRAGVILEDLGVVVDPALRYPLTLNDVLHGNEDLLGHATDVLAGERGYRIAARYSDDAGNRSFTLSTESVDRVDVYLDDQPFRSVKEPNGKRIELDPMDPAPQRASFLGFVTSPGDNRVGHNPVVSYRWPEPGSSVGDRGKNGVTTSS